MSYDGLLCSGETMSRLSHAFLCHGHTGRLSSSGFGTDFGATMGQYREVDLSLSYVLSARRRLQEAGVGTTILGYGNYGSRHAFANEMAAKFSGKVAYVACHVNAATPPGDYGLVMYDLRSDGGNRMAVQVKKQLSGLLGTKIIGAGPGDWTANGLSTIDDIYNGPANLSGICYEPFFINQPKHSEFLAEEGLNRIGVALADGLLAWGAQ